MTRHVDFSELYRRLGVGPNSSVADLTIAWRRLVASLHPDRGHTGSEEELQRLTAAYRAAREFERQTGRLPGARTGNRDDRRSRSPVHGAEPPARRRSRFRLPLLVAAGAAIAALWLASDEPRPSASSLPTPTIVMPEAGSIVPARIAVGMSRDMVRRIEGAPVGLHQDRWLYGPSWVAFACDLVSGWYSSPLHPLKVREPNRPPANTRRPRDCP